MLIPFETPVPLEDFLACRGRVEMAPAARHTRPSRPLPV
jgi:hypothetical protein